MKTNQSEQACCGNGGDTYCHFLRAWLFDYIDHFECQNDQQRLQFDFKRQHTLRVVQEITTLGQMLQLNDHEMLLAKIIALFHDIGRFEQLMTYGTYNDYRSVDHGTLGMLIIAASNVLGDLAEEERWLICDAIDGHNKLHIPEGLTNKALFFTRLIRDADKLDIFRIVIKEGRDIDAPSGDTPVSFNDDVSDSIFESVMQGKNINYDQVKNLTDLALIRIAWIFDLNFASTLQLVIDRGYIEQLAATLPSTSRVDQILSSVHNFIKIQDWWLKD